MSRAVLVLAATLLLAALSPPTAVQGSNVGGDAGIVVAVIDTGIRATHSQFDYTAHGGDGTGPAGQIVAWWDFTDEVAPVAFPTGGATWDGRMDPYDLHGHGTAVASLVGGSTLSMAPGTSMAIAKVGTATGGATGGGKIMNIEAAYRWAVDVVHADIVSISIGTILPWVGVLDTLDDQISDAHDDGVLTVVAAGNGAGNACGPATTWSTAYGYSTDVLAVGSLFEDGDTNVFFTCSQLDPDVASHGYNVPVAGRGGDTLIVTMSGTSFATPLVAGAAGLVMGAALANSHAADPDYIESIILTCAKTVYPWPYAIQGYGMFYRGQLPHALSAAQNGSVCSHPTGPISSTQRTFADAYHDLVVEAARMSLTETTDIWE